MAVISRRCFRKSAPCSQTKTLQHVLVGGGAARPAPEAGGAPGAGVVESSRAAPTARDEPAFWLTLRADRFPKGAVHCTTTGRVADLRQKVLGIRASDRVFSAAKLFSLRLGNAGYFPARRRATARLVPAAAAAASGVRCDRGHKPTLFFAVPTLRRDAGDPGRREALGHVLAAVCVSAGEALPAELLIAGRTARRPRSSTASAPPRR